MGRASLSLGPLIESTVDVLCLSAEEKGIRLYKSMRRTTGPWRLTARRTWALGYRATAPVGLDDE